MFVTLRMAYGWNNRNIENAWHNVFEFNYNGDIAYDAVSTNFNDFIQGLRLLHHPNVEFLQYTLSTWQPDSKPYNPAAFVTVPLAGKGVRNIGAAQPMADNITLFVRKQTTHGRTGRVNFRGVLTESDVEVRSDGKFILSPGSPLLNGTDWTSAYQLMEPYVNGELPEAQMVLVSGSAALPASRDVVSLILSGVTDLDPDHKWYNRTGSTNAAQ